MPGEVKSIAEHWDVLYVLLSAVVIIGLGELRYAIHRYVKKQEDLAEKHRTCQLEVTQKFAEVDKITTDITEIKQDRKDKWQRKFFPHTHYSSGEGGGVKIPLVVIKDD